jgi:hypothetical protein
LDHEDVGKARDHGLAAGSQLLGLGGHQPERAVDPIHLGRVGSLDVDHLRQDARDAAATGVWNPR